MKNHNYVLQSKRTTAGDLIRMIINEGQFPRMITVSWVLNKTEEDDLVWGSSVLGFMEKVANENHKYTADLNAVRLNDDARKLTLGQILNLDLDGALLLIMSADIIAKKSILVIFKEGSGGEMLVVARERYALQRKAKTGWRHIEKALSNGNIKSTQGKRAVRALVGESVRKLATKAA